MLRRGLVVLLVAGSAVAVLARCSLVTGNFHECDADGDCAGGKICQQSFCVVQTIPEGCFGVPDAGVAAVYGRADAGNAIHLGAAMNFTSATGTVNTTRVQHLNAMVLALDEINGPGRDGVAGRPFVLHVCDTSSRNDLLLAQVAWLADSVKTPAIVVHSSTPALSAAALTTPRGVLLMSPTATSVEITSLPNAPDSGTRLVWRTAPSDAIQGRVIGELLLGTGAFDAGLAGAAKVGVIYVNDSYGQGLNSNLVTRLAASKTVQGFPYDRGAADLSPKVGDLNTFAPNVSVLVGFSEDAPRIVSAGSALANLRRSSGHRWFFTDSAKDPTLISQSPAGELEGSYGTAAAQGVGPAYAIFKSSYQARFGVDPDTYSFMGHNYDAVYALAYAAAFAVGQDGTGAVTGQRMAAGMTKLSSGAVYAIRPDTFTAARSALQAGTSIDIDGTSGHLDFDPATGEAPAPIELWQVDAGTIKRVTVIDPGP